MKIKPKPTLMLFIGSALLLILAACTNNVVPPEMIKATQPATPSLTKELSRLEKTSPVKTITYPSTMAPKETETKTASLADYQLVDWREPTEVITPENLHKVELVGRLVFKGSADPIGWSPDGSKLGVVVEGQGTFILNATTFEKLYILGGFHFIAFSYDGLILETGGTQFDMRTGESMGSGMTLAPFPGYLTDIEFSPNGEYIAAAGTDRVDILNIKDSIVKSFSREAEPTHVSVSRDSQIMAVTYLGEEFTELWDPYQRKPIRILKLKGISGKGKPKFSRNNTSVFFTGEGTWDGRNASFIQEWDYRSGTPIDIQLLPGRYSFWHNSIDLSTKSDILAYGTVDGVVHLMPIHSCKSVELNGINKGQYMSAVAFRPDGKLLATAGGWGGNVIELWGIPAVDESPTVENKSETPIGNYTGCPEIPMQAEHPTPESDWWGGGRPRK
jgi:WD40 repeat protein